MRKCRASSKPSDKLLTVKKLEAFSQMAAQNKTLKMGLSTVNIFTDQKSAPTEAGEKAHPTGSNSHIREQLNSFSLVRSKPKRLSDPLTVWLVDSVVFCAGAHGWGAAGPCPSLSVSRGLTS